MCTCDNSFQKWKRWVIRGVSLTTGVPCCLSACQSLGDSAVTLATVTGVVREADGPRCEGEHERARARTHTQIHTHTQIRRSMCSPRG